MLIKYSINEIKAMLEACRNQGYEPKLEISFVSRYDYYVLRYGEKISFQRSGKEEDRSRVFYYENFESLANDGSLDELLLEEEWDDIDYLSCYEFDECDIWNDINRDMYFEGEDFKDMLVKNKKFAGIDTLEDIFLIFSKCCRAETAHPEFQNLWKESDATYGQSDVASMLVQDAFGGMIRMMYVNNEKHYFNEIDGKYVDLARDHYEENLIPIIYEPSEEIQRDALEADGRYAKLVERIEDYIKMVNG